MISPDKKALVGQAHLPVEIDASVREPRTRCERPREPRAEVLERLSELVARYDFLRSANERLLADYDRMRADRDAIALRLQDFSNELFAARSEINRMAEQSEQRELHYRTAL